MAALVLVMKFSVHFASLDLGTGHGLDSTPELHVVLVLVMLHTGFWVSQERTTDLIHERIPVHSRESVTTGLLDAE